jgi:hypothetical protein
MHKPLSFSPHAWFAFQAVQDGILELFQEMLGIADQLSRDRKTLDTFWEFGWCSDPPALDVKHKVCSITQKKSA